MLTHSQIWTALDRLAARAGLSPSGLAKLAGLDPTTFNKSKRITSDGRARWPSTESLSKSLAATGASIDQFVALIPDSARAPTESVPLLGLAEAGAGGHFDDSGCPSGAGWDRFPFPAIDNARAYALRISGDSMHPVYRDGATLIVSSAVPIQRGDRVLVTTRNGEILAKELKRKTAKTLELKSLDLAHDERVLPAEEVLWIARIMWASQ